jgi:hypothetical protein
VIEEIAQCALDTPLGNVLKKQVLEPLSVVAHRCGP